jgi:hypothetical protein
MTLKGTKELVLTHNHMFLKNEGNHLDPQPWLSQDQRIGQRTYLELQVLTLFIQKNYYQFSKTQNWKVSLILRIKKKPKTKVITKSKNCPTLAEPVLAHF